MEQALTLEEIALAQRRHKENELVSWVNNELTRAKNARVPFERQWFLNLAFASGRQYVAPTNIPGHGFKLTAPRAPAHRVRLVINITRKALRKECAKLTSSKPIPTVVPATNEDEDQTAAIVSEQVLKSQFMNSKFGNSYRQWIWWGAVTGASFMKSYYDPSEPDYDAMSLPQLPEGLDPRLLQYRPDLQKYFNTPVPARGKVCYSVVNPFHLYVPDLMTPDIDDQPWVIHTVVKSPEWVFNKFHFVPNADARAANTTLDAATIIAKGVEGELPNAVLVKEAWIKPGAHKMFPKGGMVTVINDRAVQILESWPCPFPEFPFYQYKGIPTGGFYDDSVIVDLIPIQKEYNRTRSQMVEIKNMMGKPSIMAEKGSIKARRITSEPGQVIEYEQGFQPPTPMQGVDYPQSMVNEVDTLRAEFDDISGQHEVSNGETPAGVTSGTALAFLGEQDESALSYQVAGIEYAMEVLGTHYLKYVANYWPEDRIVRVAGRNNTFESIHWKKNAVKGNTDVRVQTGSALPQSKAAKQALITEMMQNGFLSPEVGLEILDMAGLDKAMEDYLVDKKAAMRENLKMQEGSDKMFEMLMQPTPEQEPVTNDQGMTMVRHPQTGEYVPFQAQPPIPVNSWDNHEAHIKWHNMYRKTQQFEQLSDIKKQAFELHVQTHQAAMSMAQVNLLGTPMGGAPTGLPGQEGALPPEANGQQPVAPPPPNAQGPVGAGPPLGQDTGAMMDNMHRQQAGAERSQ